MVWTPRVTVAAVIERDGAFLVVEEHTDDGLRLNQPAGHLEAGESLIDAAIRETREETGHAFTPTGWIGTDLWTVGSGPHAGLTYLRFTLVGTVTDPLAGAELDPDIVRALWLSEAELRAQTARHRSPLVLSCLDNYLQARDGEGFLPLSALREHAVVRDVNHGK